MQVEPMYISESTRPQAAAIRLSAASIDLAYQNIVNNRLQHDHTDPYTMEE